MYVNPILVGVIATVLFEFVASLVWVWIKKGRK